jgi:hypothetical protein
MNMQRKAEYCNIGAIATETDFLVQTDTKKNPPEIREDLLARSNNIRNTIK